MLQASQLFERLTRTKLADGRVVAIRINVFNVRLVVEVDIYTEDGWCYVNPAGALKAQDRWTIEGGEEPTGWIRHPATGRRRVPIFCGECGRVNGSLEFVRW